MNVLAVVVLVVCAAILLGGTIGLLAYHEGWDGALWGIAIWVFAIVFTAAVVWAFTQLGLP